ncbi:hypothetical protein [[Clostridium] colinum]|uniref:hypothetical protein n=1 Tax=[Clostridium] colinum TaxID=36835 RepID=UPI002024DDF1|nr:hypothetical protein [[Clostridium] colinum]
MEFLYPNFERHSILKKELLNSLRDYSIEYLQVKYDKYTKGIITGFDIKILEDKYIEISKGIAKFENFIYIADKKAKIKYSETNKFKSLKIILEKDTRIKDYDKYILSYKLDENLQLNENEIEICRFKLMEGFDLRDKHKSFDDIETEFDTINYLNSTWAGIERESINPYILKTFAKEAMQNKLINIEDIVFCYTCINEEKALNIELVEYYLKNRQSLKNKEKLTKVEIYKYLQLTLNDIKTKKTNKEDYFEDNKILIL